MKIIDKAKLLLLFTLLINNTYAKEIQLEDLVNIALKNNTNITLSKNNSLRKKQSIKTSKADYLPNLSLDASRSYYDVTSSGTTLKDNLNSYTLSFSQLIYDFGQTSNNITSSKEDYEASKQEVLQKISTTILETKGQYYKILNNYQTIDLTKEISKIDALHLERAIEYFKAGIKTKIDVTDAKIQVANSSLDEIQANYDLKTSYNELNSILGEGLAKDLYIQKDKDINHLAKKIKTVKKNLDDLIKEALENKVELKIYKANIKAALAKVKIARGTYYPTLNLNASYYNTTADDLSSLDEEQSLVGVSLQWNLYTGNSTQAAIKTALLNLASLKQEMKQEEIEIEEELTTSFYKVKRNEKSIIIALQNVTLSTEKLDLAKQRYEHGLNDLLELNDSKLQYSQAKIELINTYYSYLNSIANLDYARGYYININ